MLNFDRIMEEPLAGSLLLPSAVSAVMLEGEWVVAEVGCCEVASLTFHTRCTNDLALEVVVVVVLLLLITNMDRRPYKVTTVRWVGGWQGCRGCSKTFVG